MTKMELRRALMFLRARSKTGVCPKLSQCQQPRARMAVSRATCDPLAFTAAAEPRDNIVSVARM